MKTGTRMDAVDTIVEQWESSMPDLDFSSLHIVSRMLRLMRIFEHQRQAILAEVGLEPWSFDTLAAIRRTSNNTATPGELTEATLVTSGTMSTRLRLLQEKGWIVRVQGTHDRRVVHVELTIPGRQVFDNVVSSVVACQQRFMETLTVRDQSVMKKLLRTMLEGVDPHA